MAVCQFFLRGTCKFGDGCRNEHPANARQSGFGNSGWTTSTQPKPVLPYNAANIANDLTAHVDKPLWPLTSYAPAKHEPLLLAGLDESPEELRVKAFTAIRAGNVNEYLQYEANQIAAAEQVYANARDNSAQAYEKAAQQSAMLGHAADSTATPNKPSAFGGNTGSAFPSTSSAFNVTSAPSAFGNTTTPSAFASTSTPSAFGNTSTPSAFGTSTTPSAFANPGATPSVFGTPAFGQPAFGRPAFGQPAFAQTGAFGQPLNNAAPQSAFGQPSAFGQAAQQPSASVIKPASGAFSAFANTGNAPAAGGQPSAFGGSVFGQPSFGQPVPAASAAPAPSAPVFGTPSAFGQQPSAPVSAFGDASTTASNPTFGQSAFGNANAAAQAASGTSAFGNPSAFGDASNSTQSQNLSAFAPTAPSISMEMKSSVSSGPPDFAITKSPYKPGSTPYDHQLPPKYAQLLPKSAMEAFQSVKFDWGTVPEWVPPLEVR
ncbi:hypothetical protein B0H34DRAFT_787201 [Crassisporium funariophilum]|nr:hypothetical protein B0H34DRAFT_787201 [Crassisporium funariophilum]